jgi:hypothetical protein
MVTLFLILSVFSTRDIDGEKIFGTWQVEKVVYLDQQPVRARDGENMQWQFTRDGFCHNLTHQSKTRYSIKGDQLNLDGYSNTIEKLNDHSLVIRENKQFFIRRIYFKKVD